MYIIITLYLATPPPTTVHSPILTLLTWLHRRFPDSATKTGPSQAPILRCASRQPDWNLPHMDSSQRPNKKFPQCAPSQIHITRSCGSFCVRWNYAI